MPEQINIPAWDTVRCSKCGEYRPKGNGEKWNGRQCPECVRQARREHRWTARGRKYNAICKEGPECFIKAARAMPRVCNRCGSTEGIVPDHDIPLIGRGPHCGLNVVPLCGRCNFSKGGSVEDIDGNRYWPAASQSSDPETRANYLEALIADPLIDLHSLQDKNQATEPNPKTGTRKKPPRQPVITHRGGLSPLPAHLDRSPRDRARFENPDQWNIKMPGSRRIYRVSKFEGRWSCDYRECRVRRCKHITEVLKYLRANGHEPE